MMQSINLDKFKAIEQAIVAEKGGFHFCALFLREDGLGKWDFMVSADWIDQGEYAAIHYIVGILKQYLSPAEMMDISKIVPIETENTELIQLATAYPVIEPPLALHHNVFFGVAVEKAYILTLHCHAPEFLT